MKSSLKDVRAAIKTGKKEDALTLAKTPDGVGFTQRPIAEPTVQQMLRDQTIWSTLAAQPAVERHSLLIRLAKTDDDPETVQAALRAPKVLALVDAATVERIEG